MPACCLGKALGSSRFESGWQQCFSWPVLVGTGLDFFDNGTISGKIALDKGALGNPNQLDGHSVRFFAINAQNWQKSGIHKIIVDFRIRPVHPQDHPWHADDADDDVIHSTPTVAVVAPDGEVKGIQKVGSNGAIEGTYSKVFLAAYLDF